MSAELQRRLTELINRAMGVEKQLAAHPYQEPVEHVCRLDELHSCRLQAQELIRCCGERNGERDSGFSAAYQEVAAKLEHEIAASEECIPAECAEKR